MMHDVRQSPAGERRAIAPSATTLRGAHLMRLPERADYRLRSLATESRPSAGWKVDANTGVRRDRVERLRLYDGWRQCEEAGGNNGRNAMIEA
jgi:hypothetical protein